MSSNLLEPFSSFLRLRRHFPKRERRRGREGKGMGEPFVYFLHLKNLNYFNNKIKRGGGGREKGEKKGREGDDDDGHEVDEKKS